ncbi:anaerobic benzoate catabolism transcriptional regulator [Roseovarius albus]|uniref:Anaerobic benzoate catabolism transcriptional regulator n=1 Tax=Roseovarius albus TaxID=1247867 RepID=A0A1X6Z0P7_9RHOB|nr:helix-turn-helix domain-containing protein [Roseovarius albus]SLN35101.1 anaerobic benzoate catabolism transcriptional regulator [Roseovarius albus]
MSVMTIDAVRLKTVRKARKLGRPRLAKMSGLTERQVARFEGAGTASGEASIDTVSRLSEALGVPLGVLIGELDLIDEDLKPDSETRCTNGCCG